MLAESTAAAATADSATSPVAPSPGKRTLTGALPARGAAAPAGSSPPPVQRRADAGADDPFGFHLADARPPSGDPIASLQEAATRGRDALWTAIDQGGAAAAAALPQAGEAVLELVWPSGTGWRFTGDLQAAGFIGLDLGLEVAIHGSAAITIVRTGPVVEVEVERSIGVGASGEAQDVIEGNLGSIPVRGADGFSLSTDLARVPWPTAMLTAIRGLDPRGAVRGLVALGKAFWAATTVHVEARGGGDLTGEGGVGSGALGEASVGGSLGATLGASRTVGPDGEEAELTLTLDGALSLAAEVSPVLRDALADLQAKLPLMRPIDPDAPALRSGDYLPGPSDSANSANVAGNLGLIFRREQPTGQPSRWTAGFTGELDDTLALLGQSVSSSLHARVLYPCDQLAALIRTLGHGTTVPVAIMTMEPVELEGTLAMTLQDLTACALFPGFDVGALPGVADRMDAVSATITTDLAIDPSWLVAQVAVPMLAGFLAPVIALMRAGKPIEAALALLHALATLPGAGARMVLTGILRGVDLELAQTDDHFFDQQTPGYSLVPGAQAQGGVTASKIYRYHYEPGAPGLSLATLAGLLARMAF